MRTHRRAAARPSARAAAIVLFTTACGFGCATGGTTTPGGDYTPTDDGGGAGGSPEAGPDGSGGTGGTAGQDAAPDSTATGGGGQAGDAAADVSPDSTTDAATDAPSEAGSETGAGLPLGSACSTNAECASGFCDDVGQPGAPNKACIRPCLPNTPCPDGTRCTTVSALGKVCAPYHDEACATCATDDDCKIQGNHCLSASGGQLYCAVDCSFDGTCPTGLECQTVSGNKVCVPQGGAQCPCAPNRNGDTRPCQNTANGIVCTGVETCDGSQGAFVGCTATTPSPEVCNGLDDDCNGVVDDLPHATCSCSGGTCTMVCAPGYTNYPAGLPQSDGCPCVVDAFQSTDGGSCGTPHAVAAVADVGGTASRTISGTLSSDTEVDWFALTFTDTAESGTNSFHASIALTSNPNDEFVFVVVSACTAAPTAPQYTSVDTCVNFSNGGAGEAPCGNVTGQNHCDDRSIARLVGVMRNPAATTKTCSAYELTIAAAGPCDPSTADTCTW